MIVAELRAIAGSLMMMTNLPIPAAWVDERAARQALRWLPLSGVVVGLAQVGAGMGALALGLPSGAAAALAIGAGAWMTGGLHEDGLADTFDGLAGGRSPERRLEIMKDPRLGSHGATALLVCTLLRWSLMQPALESGDWLGLLCAAALSRLPPVWLSQVLPYARPQGAASAIAGPPGLAGAFAALLCLPLLLPDPLRLSLLLCPALITFWLGRWARAAIGGYTGDVLGASILLCEGLSLAGLALLRAQEPV